jgi:hypothetical protein
MYVEKQNHHLVNINLFLSPEHLLQGFEGK